MFFFFFSSRRRHTRSLCDWSSDVCSSDLGHDPEGCPDRAGGLQARAHERRADHQLSTELRNPRWLSTETARSRSEERRVGKECRSRWSGCHEKKKMIKKEGERGT